jgi:hypothetical protein
MRIVVGPPAGAARGAPSAGCAEVGLAGADAVRRRRVEATGVSGFMVATSTGDLRAAGVRR